MLRGYGLAVGRNGSLSFEDLSSVALEKGTELAGHTLTFSIPSSILGWALWALEDLCLLASRGFSVEQLPVSMPLLVSTVLLPLVT